MSTRAHCVTPLIPCGGRKHALRSCGAVAPEVSLLCCRCAHLLLRKSCWCLRVYSDRSGVRYGATCCKHVMPTKCTLHWEQRLGLSVRVTGLRVVPVCHVCRVAGGQVGREAGERASHQEIEEPCGGSHLQTRARPVRSQRGYGETQTLITYGLWIGVPHAAAACLE